MPCGQAVVVAAANIFFCGKSYRLTGLPNAEKRFREDSVVGAMSINLCVTQEKRPLHGLHSFCCQGELPVCLPHTTRGEGCRTPLLQFSVTNPFIGRKSQVNNEFITNLSGVVFRELQRSHHGAQLTYLSQHNASLGKK